MAKHLTATRASIRSFGVCPKERWGSLCTIEAALALAVQIYNKGSTALISMLLQLELATEPSLEEYVEKADNTRVKTAARKSSGKERAKRTRMEIARRQERPKNDRNVKDHSMKQGGSKDKLDTSGPVRTVTTAFSKCWNWHNLPSVILRSSIECFQNYVLNYYSFTFKGDFLKN